MYSSAQPVIVERHLPLMPMGLISPACCWASIDDDLNYMFHIAHGRGTVMTQSGIIRFTAPCAVIIPAGEAHNFQFELNASGMAPATPVSGAAAEITMKVTAIRPNEFLRS